MDTSAPGLVTMPPLERTELYARARAWLAALELVHAGLIVSESVFPGEDPARISSRAGGVRFGERSGTIYPRDRWGQLAPEQTGRIDEVLGPETDLYNWAALVHLWACGRPVFEASDGEGVLGRVLFEVPALEWCQDPSWPQGLREILGVALAKERRQRYRSASGLLADWDLIWRQSDRGMDAALVLRSLDFPHVFEAPQGMPLQAAVLSAVDAAVVAAREGGPYLLSLRGATGYGKSKLIETLAAERDQVDFPWLLWDGALDHEVPFGGLRKLLEQLLSHPAWMDGAFRSAVLQSITDRLGDAATVLSRIVPAWEDWAGPDRTLDEAGTSLKARIDYSWAALLAAVLAQGPVCLVIDDADSLGRESQGVLDLVLSGPAAKRLLLLAVVGPDDPNELSLNRSLVGWDEVELQPLGLADLEGVVRGLPAHEDQVVPLTEVLFAKTHGVPSRLAYCLETIGRLEMARADRSSLSWRFDLARVEELEMPGGQVNYLERRLALVPHRHLTVLMVLAHFPAGLGFAELVHVWQSVFPQEAPLQEADVEQLFRQAWILRHPLVRIGSRQLTAPLLAMGSLEERFAVAEVLLDLRLHAPPPTGVEEAWVIAHELTLASPEQRLAHAPLMVATARVLVHLGAYERSWFLLSLLSPREWAGLIAGDASFLFIVTVAGLAGKKVELDELVTLLDGRLTARESALELGFVLAFSWLHQGDLRRSMHHGLKTLTLAGAAVPDNPSLMNVIVESIQLGRSLRGFRIEKFLERRANPTRTQTVIHDLLQGLSPPAFFLNPLLLSVLTARHIRLGLKIGASSALAVSFASLAFQRAVVFRSVHDAKNYLDVAERILTHLPSQEVAVRAEFLANAFIRWWYTGLSLTAGNLVATGKASLALGQVNNGYNGLVVGFYYQFWSGQDLTHLTRDIIEFEGGLNLRGDSQNAQLLGAVAAAARQQSQGESEPWDGYVRALKDIKAEGRWNAYFAIGSLKVVLDYCEDRPAPGKEIFLDYMERVAQVGVAAYSNAIILAVGSLGTALDSAQSPNLKACHRARGVLAAFARTGGTAAHGLVALIDAALAFRRRDFAVALAHCTRAIDGFMQSEQTVLSAIALELRALVQSTEGYEELARKDWRSAYWIWNDMRWTARVRALEGRFAWISPHTSARSVGNRLESLETFAKVSQDLLRQSSRPALATLLTKVLGDPGTERVLIIIREGQSWMSLEKNTRALGPSDVPQVLLRQAWDQRQPIVVNGSRSAGSREDAWLRSHKGSLALLPLVRGDRTQALVLIEHPQLPGAFPPKRLETLLPLVEQVATSFENLSLMEDMEARMLERNSELMREKERAQALLLNILPRTAAEELQSTGRTRARFFRGVTVLLLDFVSFTTAAEAMSAQELVDLIDEYFSGFDRLVEEHGLEKIKTMGDAYMAVAGLQQDDQDTAFRAVALAKAMHAFVAQVGERRRASGKPVFGARIGLHTGDLVGGVVGTKKFQFDIWGDTVNTAARMEQACEPGRINLSQSTWEVVRDRVATTPRGKLAAKNKGDLDMYFVD